MRVWRRMKTIPGQNCPGPQKYMKTTMQFILAKIRNMFEKKRRILLMGLVWTERAPFLRAAL